MFKNTHIWLPSCIKQNFFKKKRGNNSITRHILFCIADHFEPRWGKVDKATEIRRTDAWIKGFSGIIKDHRDADKCKPRYTFFYPIDEFTPEVMERIAGFCKEGHGEIELHLHHDNDTPENLKVTLNKAKELFSKYGALSKDKKSGDVRFGFIHGNWSLDNSRRDGRWCGVNNELTILREAGCYADFTLPSAPSDTQTSKINSIYYAKDTPGPKSHNTGVDVGFHSRGVLSTPGVEELMIIQGPLALNWKNRKFGVIPKIENGNIALNNPPGEQRVDLWVDQNIGVKSRPEWIFVKVHTHGAQDGNLTDEHFQNLDRMFSCLERKYNDGVNYRLHYVTAREMYNIVKAAENGETGEPGKYRDYVLCRT